MDLVGMVEREGAMNDFISLGVIFEDFLPELFPFDFFCLLTTYLPRVAKR
jgi:hypothetical protein